MDLASLDTRRVAEEGVEVELRDPISFQPLGVYITVHGMDAAVFRDQLIANAKQSRARLAAERRLERTADEVEAEGVELLVACTKSWRNLELDGAALECTPGNARTVYARFPWIRQQLDAFIGDRANFLPRSGAGS